jgi:hypothetical protein
MQLRSWKANSCSVSQEIHSFVRSSKTFDAKILTASLNVSQTNACETATGPYSEPDE